MFGKPACGRQDLCPRRALCGQPGWMQCPHTLGRSGSDSHLRADLAACRKVACRWPHCDRQVSKQRCLAVSASHPGVVLPAAGVTAGQLQRCVTADGCSAACAGGPRKSAGQDTALVDAECRVDRVRPECLLPVAASPMPTAWPTHRRPRAPRNPGPIQSYPPFVISILFRIARARPVQVLATVGRAARR